MLAPEQMWLVSALLVAATGGLWLARRPVLAIYAAVAFFVLALNKEAGLQLNQVLYGLFAYATLGVWYLQRLSTAEPFVRTLPDKLIAVMLFVGGPLAVVIGVAFGGDLVKLRGELIAFSMLAFYFPVKEIVRQEQRGPEILIGLVLFIATVVALRNVLSFREIMLSATEAWHIADARPGQGRGFNLNEMQLMAGAIAALVLLLHLRHRGVQLLLLTLSGLFVFGLVMTRSRGYWVAFALSVIALFLLFRGPRRWRFAAVMTGGAVVSVAATYILLGPVLLNLLIEGTIERFTSLERAATQDISLLNRFEESRSAAAKGMQSPILGWGFGSYYHHYDIVYKYTKTDFFIHNGYVALWFKHGILGLITILGAWAISIGQAARTARTESAPLLHRAIALSAAAFLIGIIVSASTSNPFPLRDQMFFFALFLGLAAGLYDRYLGSRRDDSCVAGGPSAAA